MWIQGWFVFFAESLRKGPSNTASYDAARITETLILLLQKNHGTFLI